MYLDGNGGYTYQEPGANLAGQWEWMETGQAGGVLVLHYTTPTVTQTFDNVIRFGIIWQDQNSIILSDPVGGGQFPLHRQF